jgi:Ca2+/Na+ antiporter
MTSWWFRLVLFVLLLSLVVALVAYGHASVWAVVIAALGLAMLLFNSLVYKSNAWVRAMQYRESDDIKQSDFGKAYNMGCGALLWLAALVFAIGFVTRK